MTLLSGLRRQQLDLSSDEHRATASLSLSSVNSEAASKESGEHRDVAEHKWNSLKGLSVRNVLRDCDRVPHVFSSSIFRFCGEVAWLSQFYGVYATRPPIFDPAPNFAG